jgi:UDP-N-acetylglucosamine 2-epimerase
MTAPINLDVLTILGARPQFVKASVVSKTFQEEGIKEGILHTGQHYEYQMDSLFFKQLNIPEPLINLNIGSGTQAHQTGQMMMGIEQFLLSMDTFPKLILLYGDTNSTLAGALVAAKLGLPIVHIEAGLRSFNSAMPEEINRVVTDRLSQFLFCPSEVAVGHLQKEGITKGVYCVGDVMFEAFNNFSPLATAPKEIDFDWSKDFGLLTLHRPSNTENITGLKSFLKEVGTLPYSILWPLHPRMNQHLQLIHIPSNITVCSPLGYLEMLFCLKQTKFVITDSGGLQKEAYWAKKPIFTVRKETEWTETVEAGWNQLIDLEVTQLSDLLKMHQPNPNVRHLDIPDASKKITEKIKEFLN